VSGYLPDGSISLTSSILWALPATVPQLADKFYSSDNIITMLLCRLRERGLVVRTDQVVKRPSGKGRQPHIWDRV
jgi:hypothetical protein